MVQPNEMKLNLPMELSHGVLSTTTKVWEMLWASFKGDVEQVKKLSEDCPQLLYAQYNYHPPIHFAVREGHLKLVEYFLDNGAHDASYKTYPFSDSLETIAADRGFPGIYAMLTAYVSNHSQHLYTGDNGKILFKRTREEMEFEKAVNDGDLAKTETILKNHPEFAKDETYFWGEGILTMPAKENQQALLDLLMGYGAKVPSILKWAQFYYFEHDEGAAYMLRKQMNPNTMSCHHVTILHDMAQKGNLPKAELLIKYGADVNLVDEEYQSTPLGMAARWGHPEMVEYLLMQGADVHKAGALWATPLAWAKKKGHTEIETMLVKAGALE